MLRKPALLVGVSGPEACQTRVEEGSMHHGLLATKLTCGLNTSAGFTTQRVQLECHYGIRSQNPFPIMVLGALIP